MSVRRDSPDTETYRCSQCGGERDPRTSVKGSFCSTRCYEVHRRRKRARDLLNTLRYDHRFCATCFRKIKTVDRPPADRWGLPDCLIGYEDATHHAVEGELTISVDDYGRERLVGHSEKCCTCGNTSHAQADPTLQTRFAFEIAEFLRDAIADLRLEGKTDHDVDDTALDAALCEHLLATESSPRSPDVIDWEVVLAAALDA